MSGRQQNICTQTFRAGGDKQEWILLAKRSGGVFVTVSNPHGHCIEGLAGFKTRPDDQTLEGATEDGFRQGIPEGSERRGVK